ncbi:unnamed protein product [Protopolystoma xenopodis]|uniref:Uncharacterized protein n=1 Tax=Protopolystoma xenopodis TaxID=117903 RepID=A0A448WDL7_9PLAT|nr:unnamed protein product [Protopolystoma xenopodis]
MSPNSGLVNSSHGNREQCPPLVLCISTVDSEAIPGGDGPHVAYAKKEIIYNDHSQFLMSRPQCDSIANCRFSFGPVLYIQSVATTWQLGFEVLGWPPSR